MTEAGRVRREPPRFRTAAVTEVSRRSARLLRVTLRGPELVGWAVEEPAASVRLLLPDPATGELPAPAWNGNEFLLENGRRPTIRTLTPRRTDPVIGELDVEIVDHGEGAASTWAINAGPGTVAGVAGPGRGYQIDAGARRFLLAGDETAIPAMSQLLEVLPADRSVAVLVEVAHPDAELDLPAHPHATVQWNVLPPEATPGDTLVAAVREADLEPDTQVWAAGEAAAMQRIRRHLFEERSWPRSQATVRGYWKTGAVLNS